MGDTIACPDGRIMHSSARGGAKRDGVADDGAATAELLVPPGAPTPCLGRVVGLKRPGQHAHAPEHGPLTPTSAAPPPSCAAAPPLQVLPLYSCTRV